jgi:protein-S-isoprenylcysteine O-methyltransferase Ste14
VVAPPPLLYAGAVTVGLLAKALFPVRFLPRTVTLTFGGPLVGSGLLLVLSGLRAMRRAGTEVRPDRPTTSLVIDGPYRFTRNPLYLGLTLMYGGITALANSLPSELLLPLVLLIMRRGVIEREQRYLERSFGEEYVQYKTRVRRWILNVYVVLGCSARAPSCRPVENVQACRPTGRIGRSSHPYPR